MTLRRKQHPKALAPRSAKAIANAKQAKAAATSARTATEGLEGEGSQTSPSLDILEDQE